MTPNMIPNSGGFAADLRRFPILLDIDGVVLDWTSGFETYMERQGYKRRDVPQTTYHMSSLYPGIDIVKRIEDFSLHPSYSKLGFIPGAKRGIERLRDAFPFCQMIAVTCCGKHPAAVAVREAALRELALDGIVPLGIRDSKRPVFETYAPGLVIEDSPENVLHALDAGHVALTFDQPYNRLFRACHEGERRMAGWQELAAPETETFVRRFL